jgi:uncharacterized membrane protein
MKNSLPLVVFALLGLIDATYITYEKLSGLIPPCSAHFQCETVLTSSWSSIGPVPLSVLGMFFYLSFLIVAIVHYVFPANRKLTPLLLFILGIIGSLFSFFLIFLMGKILHAWCAYCLLSALNCQVLFLLSSAVFAQSHKKRMI